MKRSMLFCPVTLAISIGVQNYEPVWVDFKGFENSILYANVCSVALPTTNIVHKFYRAPL